MWWNVRGHGTPVLHLSKLLMSPQATSCSTNAWSNDIHWKPVCWADDVRQIARSFQELIWGYFWQNDHPVAVCLDRNCSAISEGQQHVMFSTWSWLWRDLADSRSIPCGSGGNAAGLVGYIMLYNGTFNLKSVAFRDIPTHQRHFWHRPSKVAPLWVKPRWCNFLGPRCMDPPFDAGLSPTV